MKERIKEKISMLHIDISDEQAEQYVKYYEMLVKRNKVMNLTAITEFEDVLDKHFVDSLSLVNAIDIHKITSIIDVGTGAGFPGIPLKIAFPHLKVTLLDSLNKRIHFLNDVIDTLGLENVETCHGRAEDFGHKAEYREHYDLCTSRAVANLTSLSEYCLPFVRQGGYFVSYKSGTANEEIEEAKKAVQVLGGKLDHITSYELPGTEFGRTLVAIKKVKPTGKKYPRKAGTPTKEPIK